MSIKRIDYKEAREYYIKGEGDEYPSLYDVCLLYTSDAADE